VLHRSAYVAVQGGKVGRQ